MLTMLCVCIIYEKWWPLLKTARSDIHTTLYFKVCI